MGVVVAAALGASMSGCQTAPPRPAPEPGAIERRIDAALQRIAERPQFTRGADYAAPAPGLADAITTTYHGDAAVLLRAVASARGKTLKVHGPKPHLPLVVQVTAVNVPYEDFLRDVGYQFGQRADLVLGDGFIEIRYRGQHQQR